LLKVEDLKVNYGQINAVKGISFEVKEKEIVTLIGSNGAGKTSTLRSISNLIWKSGGKVTFMGEDITKLKPSEIVKRGVCHVPEGRHIFPFLSVEENLFMGSYANNNRDKSNYKKNLEEVYSLFPVLKERRKQMGGTLSGGEQQMLAIGRGLMLEPTLIFFDEPSLGLAPILVEQIFKHIEKIREMGKTLLLVEQNARKALKIADRGYVMETGKIIFSDTADKIAKDPKLAKAYLGIA